MARDFEPPVRERDAVPARRAARREAVPDEPERGLTDPEQAYPASRVARDEHRPRRGTLPDRRLLRRDPLPDPDAPIQLGPPPESQDADSDAQIPAAPLELDPPDRERSSYDALRASAPQTVEATPVHSDHAPTASPERESRSTADVSGRDPQSPDRDTRAAADRERRSAAATSGRETQALAQSPDRDDRAGVDRERRSAAATPGRETQGLAQSSDRDDRVGVDRERRSAAATSGRETQGLAQSPDRDDRVGVDRERRSAAATSGREPRADLAGSDSRAGTSEKGPRTGDPGSDIGVPDSAGTGDVDRVARRAAAGEGSRRAGEGAPSATVGAEAAAVAGDSAVSTEGLSGSEQSARERARRVVTEGARPRDSDRVEGERMDGEGTRGVDAVADVVPPALESPGPVRDRVAERPEAGAEARPRRPRGPEVVPGEVPPGSDIARVGEPATRERRIRQAGEPEGRRAEGERRGEHGSEREGRRTADLEGRGRERGPDAPGRERRRAPGAEREGQHGEGRHAPRAEGRERADGRHAPRADGRERAAGRDPRRPEGDPRRTDGPETPRPPDAARGEAREAQRPSGAEGRPRPTDADRVHLGGRTGTPARPRRPRPEGESADRPERGRQARTRPERPATDEQKRTAARKTKSDKAAQSKAAKSAAAKRRAAAKKKQSGPKLLDDAARAKLEVVAREQNGLRAAWATFRLHTDDLRRRNFAARAERMEYGSVDEFDRTTAQLTDRGYIGAGGGRMNVIGRPVEYRATTAQVAGLWPWSVGAGAPLIGTPLGSHLHTGAPVCFDPMNWFMRGSFITAPSLFVLGLNGFGKSSLVRRIVLGGVAQGITPLILADVKPDYRKLVELVDGQVIDLGYGHGKLNPLAAGVLGSIVPKLDHLPELQIQVMQELRARQTTLVAGLVELVRGARVRDYEETLISTALTILYRTGSKFTPDQPPIIEDLLTVIITGGEEMQLDAGADNAEEYQNAIKGLRRSLRALTQGPFGAVFNGQTTTPIDTTATAVCIDVSHIPSGDKKLKAAVMLACWADGFASVEAAHVLADADLGPQRYFQVVMDELWQVLGLGDFMVDRVDELTRLQRGIATSLIMISHTIKDLQSLGSEAAISKALGFLERARAKIFGALPAEEIARLDSTVPFTSAEEDMVTSWSAPQALTGEALKPGQHRPPAPGTGKFLLKIGEDRRPGIPFQMEFTPSEKESGIHDTNQRFSEFTESTARRGTDDGSAA
ncbi:hypothetical protein [Nocardia sp. NBC_01327]|uniref:hypothetical protein n=1 Tax=Nocardia sp. NBC_01327 TaxID=2903593 RepID=UPI002E13848C|nr:hypothetical protein OG326_17010 [Nocardia sp. NBC_01327]